MAKGTHTLNKAHGVLFDPERHFIEDAPPAGTRIKLPAGTEVIPSDGELLSIADRLDAIGVEVAAAAPRPVKVLVNLEDDDEPPVGWAAKTKSQLVEMAEGIGLDVTGKSKSDVRALLEEGATQS